ncbi:MAG: metallophosphoesterase [Oscillospiraceae bacterium]|nr:metallophosphoesterase [Oscillospiraceae bacterium]
MSEELYRRRDGETLLQYHRRLVNGKLVDKTIDLDYTELSELVYGQHYSSDVARRMLYGSRKTLELLDAERTNGMDDDMIAELDEKIAQSKMETQKLRDQRREYNKLMYFDGRMEHLYERLVEAAENLRDTIGDLNFDVPFVPNDAKNENEAVLVFADWHYGLKTSNAFNEYDTEICKCRVEKVVNDAAERIALHGCKKLHIVILGDLFHGAIHTSARVASEELVCDQIMQVSEILAQAIEYLSHFCPKVEVYATYGNHGRTVQNKKDSIHQDNMEKLIPWWLTYRLDGCEGVCVHNGEVDEFVFPSVCGHEFCAVHGDNDTVRQSPKLLTTLFQKVYGKNVEYILLGDKHHGESFEELGVTAIMCGSLCGTDDYANGKRLYSTPSQLLMIVNPACGVDAMYRIKC